MFAAVGNWRMGYLKHLHYKKVVPEDSTGQHFEPDLSHILVLFQTFHKVFCVSYTGITLKKSRGIT